MNISVSEISIMLGKILQTIKDNVTNNHTTGKSVFFLILCHNLLFFEWTNKRFFLLISSQLYEILFRLSETGQ